MKALNPRAFDERLEKDCSDSLKEIVDYLMSMAANAGAGVSQRRYAPKTGWGITYYAEEQWFCQFHPKHTASHVWALIHGADPVALKSAGFAPADRRDKQPWVSDARGRATRVDDPCRA